jgi:C4-dicarboxylate-specific signal transduction histidine kinase
MIFQFVHADSGVLTNDQRVLILDFGNVIRSMWDSISTIRLHTLQLRLSRTEKLATLGQMAVGINLMSSESLSIGSTTSLLLDEFEQSDQTCEIDVISHETKRMDRIVIRLWVCQASRNLLAQFTLSDLINAVLKVLVDLCRKHIVGTSPKLRQPTIYPPTETNRASAFERHRQRD